MRITTRLKAAALIGLAVVAGLLGTSGTWALWNAAVPSGAGTIQAANFNIQLNNAPMGTTATAIMEASGVTLTPSTPVYARVEIKNATNAGTPMTVNAVMDPPRVVNPSTTALGTALSVRADKAPASGSCADAKYLESTSVTTSIAQGGIGRFCLRMSLPTGADPKNLTTAKATISTTVTVTQRLRGQ